MIVTSLIVLTGDKGLSVYDGELVVHDVLLTFGSNKGSGCPETTNLASADTLAIEVTEQTNLKLQVIVKAFCSFVVLYS